MRTGKTERAVTLVMVGLLVSGCTEVANPPTVARATLPRSTTTITATVDTRPTTTAAIPEFNLPEFHLPGATPPWERTVAHLYGPACGGSRESLSAEFSDVPAAPDCPIGGTAATSSMGAIELAAATIGPDVVYGVDDGAGFRIVAARLPSLSAPALHSHGTESSPNLSSLSDRMRGQVKTPTGRGPTASILSRSTAWATAA